MGARKITSKQYFRTAKVIHGALVGGVVFFALTVTYLMSEQNVHYGYDDTANIFYMAVGLLGLGSLFGGDIIFKAQLRKAKIHPALPQKMMQYQTANIIKYALIESVALFSMVAALLTLSVWFLYIAGFLVLVLASYYPSIDRAIKELDLNVDEQKQVGNPDAYISEDQDSNKL
jgi:hypothetical protein